MNIELILYTIIFLAVGIGLTIYGLSFGWQNFAPNLIAGWGQFCFELVIGLFIIDKFMKRQNNKQWEKVRHIHYSILNEHLIKLLVKISMKFNFVDIVKNLMYKKKNRKEISGIIENLVKELNYLDSQEDMKHRDIFIEYHNDIKEDIKEIRTEFIPRIMEHTDDQDLINKLSELDLSIIKFGDDITRIKCKESANIDFMRFIQLVECIGNVVDKLC